MHSDRGFTMIETLVALIVFGMIAGAVQLGLSATFRNARIADGQQRALAQAKRLLAEAGISRPLIVGVQSGSVDDALHWKITTEAIARPSGVLESFSRNGAQTAYAVDVSVAWRDASSLKERTVALKTIRMGRTVP